jgi:pSer/pThr/pTyr-binding forkhead associated (FHA) protein/vacuolar-type H+-ATPase subunit H
MGSHTFIIIAKSQGKSQRYEIDQETFVIGRGREADLSLNIEGLSRKHMKVSLNHQKISIKDLGSTNGTSIDGRMIHSKEKVLLQAGTKISIPNSNLSLIISLKGESQQHDTKENVISINTETRQFFERATKKLYDTHGEINQLKGQFEKELKERLAVFEKISKDNIANLERESFEKRTRLDKEIRALQEESSRLKENNEELVGIAKVESENIIKSAIKTAQVIKNQTQFKADMAPNESYESDEQINQSILNNAKHYSELKIVQSHQSEIDKEMNQLLDKKKLFIENEVEILKEQVLTKAEIQAKEESLKIIKDANQKAEKIIEEAYINAQVTQGEILESSHHKKKMIIEQIDTLKEEMKELTISHDEQVHNKNMIVQDIEAFNSRKLTLKGEIEERAKRFETISQDTSNAQERFSKLQIDHSLLLTHFQEDKTKYEAFKRESTFKLDQLIDQLNTQNGQLQSEHDDLSSSLSGSNTSRVYNT